jgi:hypothetical protein
VVQTTSGEIVRVERPHGDAGAATPEWRVSGKLGPEATDALVISCSDRRYRRPMEQFLYQHLGLGNYDLIAVPGGVYMLSFADALPKQLKVGMQMVKFMVKGHSPPRMVLVAHQNCGRYREGFGTWLRRPGFSLEEKQKHDLRSVASSLRETFPEMPVDAFFASNEVADTVVFRHLEETAA